MTQRIQEYRHFAEAAERQAAEADDPDVRLGFEQIAEAWRKMADEVEAGCRQPALKQVANVRFPPLAASLNVRSAPPAAARS